MPAPEIAITGLGVWSAAGVTPEQLWANAAAARCPVKRQHLGDDSWWTCAAPDPEPIPGFTPARRMDRSVRLALAAATAAWNAARLTELDPARVAILVGNSRGPVGQWHQILSGGTGSAAPRARPSQAAHSAVGGLSGALSLALKARGPCLTLSATCASAAHAIAVGASLVRDGVADAVLAGGAEAPLVPPLLQQFAAAHLLGTHDDPTRLCRPFDRQRNGMVPGEGAGFLVLERAEAARCRAVRIRARLAAAALGAECHNRVAASPDGSGLVQVMNQALERASLKAAAIGHVNAHGTGTRVNDAAESAALRRVFGPALDELAVTSTKPVTGHGFGAGAAFEAILAVLALEHHLAPPTAGFQDPDPDLGLTPVHGVPRPFDQPWVMSNSLGFWGNTASLIFAAA